MAEINKIHIQTERTAAVERKQIVMEMNYVLPDSKPRISSLVSVEVTPVFTALQLTDDTLNMSISADCNVVYDAVSVSEEEEHAFTTALRFTKSFKESIIFRTEYDELPEESDFSANIKLDSVDVTLVSDRKLTVRAVAYADAVLNETVGHDIAESFADDNVVSKCTYAESMRPVGTVRSQIFIKEDVKPETELPQADVILAKKTSVKVDSQRIEDGKAVIYGTIITDILFASYDEEAPFYSMQSEVGFNHAIELPKVTEDAEICIKTDGRELSVDSKENGIFSLEGIVYVEAEVYDYFSYDAIEDAFIPGKILDIERTGVILTDNFIMSDNVGACQEKLRPEKYTADKVMLADVTAKECTACIKGKNICFDGIYKITALYVPKGESKLLRIAEDEVPFGYSFEADDARGDVFEAEIKISGVSAVVNDFGEITLRWGAEANAKSRTVSQLSLVSAVSERDEPQMNDKAIYYHFIAENETCWDIAKKFGVRPELLCSMNKAANESELEAMRGIVIIKK